MTLEFTLHEKEPDSCPSGIGWPVYRHLCPHTLANPKNRYGIRKNRRIEDCFPGSRPESDRPRQIRATGLSCLPPKHVVRVG